MKKLYCILSVTALMLILSGCDKFLERKAQNLVVPTTCEQFKEMLQGDGYFYDMVSRNWWINLMTDDLAWQSKAKNSDGIVEDNAVITFRLAYQWASEIESESNGFYDEMFGYCYNQILVANIVMENIDDMIGTADEKEILRGQALFQRAYAYFYLASLYSDIYSVENLAKPCVPLKLAATPSTDTYDRSTIGDIWQQIRSDISESVNCLTGHRIINIYEINGNVALVLAMRTALNMCDFDAVIEYGGQLMERNDKLFDITSKTTCVTEVNATGGSDVAGFISDRNPEILWLYGNKSYTVGTEISPLTANTYFSVSDDLVAQYDYNPTTGKGDHRLAYFFISPGIESLRSMPGRYYHYNLLKFDYNDGYTRANAIRTAEAYLMMAEAYARKASPSLELTLQYLNALRSNRIDNYTALTSTDLPTAERAVEFIMQERRRELCFEELHRWWDLRRLGKPSFDHIWNSEIYRLNRGDDGYILDFPLTERAYDPSNANPRPIRNPFY